MKIGRLNLFLMQRLKEWTDYVGKAAPPQTAQEMSMEQVEERLREVVSGRYSAVSNAFAEVDYAKIFVVSKDDFREILNEHVMRLSDDQVFIFFLFFYGAMLGLA